MVMAFAPYRELLPNPKRINYFEHKPSGKIPNLNAAYGFFIHSTFTLNVTDLFSFACAFIAPGHKS